MKQEEKQLIEVNEEVSTPQSAVKSTNFIIAFLLFTFIGFYFFDYNIYYGVGTMIFLHQFLSLYFKLGENIPIRNWVGTMFTLNYLLSPALMWHWLDPHMNDIYKMQGDAENYFKYAIPAMLALLIGIYIFARKVDKFTNTAKVEALVLQYPRLPLHLILIGFASDLLYSFVPSELQLIFGALSYFKFAGFFLSLFNYQKLNFFYLLLSFGFLFVKSMTSSMFNDLLNMLFFLGFFLSLRYKPSHFIKVGGIIAGILLVVFIQNIKFTLRANVTNSLSDLTKIGKVIEQSREKNESKTFEEKVINVVFRVNQGWFTSSTMAFHQEGGYEFEKGKHSLNILQTSVVPRILAPNRIVMGDRSLFNKYSGYYVQEGSSMALGILSDGYIDFGFWGLGIVFVFGLIIGLFLLLYQVLYDKFALAIVIFPICFFNIRPDIDTYAVIGSVLKTAFVLWLFLFFMEKVYFKDPIQEPEKLPA